MSSDPVTPSKTKEAVAARQAESRRRRREGGSVRLDMLIDPAIAAALEDHMVTTGQSKKDAVESLLQAGLKAAARRKPKA